MSSKILMLALFKYQGDSVHPVKLNATQDLSSFNYFTRTTIAEHLRFATRTVIQHTKEGTRQTVGLQDNPFLVHCYVRFDGLAGVVVTQKDYVVRVAYTLINKMMSDFEAAVPDWKKFTTDQQTESEALKRDIIAYQNPSEADKLSKVQKSLDDVKDIMHKNIEEVLKRGETLDSLMDKSEDLSATSLSFYKNAKKQNQCCKAY